MAAEQLALIWDSEVIREANGVVRLVAKKPVFDMTAKDAAKMLNVSVWTVNKLWRLGLLTGCKPGAARKRKDLRASNARLVLDTASVVAYKKRQNDAAKQEQASGLW